MGQMQPKESDVVVGPEKVQNARTNATGSATHEPSDLKDRVGAKFGIEHDVNPAYAQGGNKGSKGNPGIPQ